MKSGITWRRTFPECAPGTDGVALFEGARHRPGAAPGRAAARPEALDVERHRPDPRQTARLGRHAGRSALAPSSHGPPDRTLAGAASAQADDERAATGLGPPPERAFISSGRPLAFYMAGCAPLRGRVLGKVA